MLNDLVGCMNEAMNEIHGENQSVDLIQWTDSWLKKQGPNTLIVEASKKGDGSHSFKLNVRQGFANEYASEEYRE